VENLKSNFKLQNVNCKLQDPETETAKLREIIQKIKKPFGLEEKNGCTNFSVIGGFSSYVMNWAQKALDAVSGIKYQVSSKGYIISNLNELKKIFEGYISAKINYRVVLLKQGLQAIGKIEKFLEDPGAFREEIAGKKARTAQDLSSPAQYLKGVGPKRARILGKVGVGTIRDLLMYFPFRYEDRSRLTLIAQLQDGDEKTIQAIVKNQKLIRTRRGMLLKVILTDGTGEVGMACFNQYYLKDILIPGTSLVLTGKFSRREASRSRRLEVSSFTYEVLRSAQEGETPEDEMIHTNRIVPIYPVTERLNMRFLRALIKHTLDEYLPALSDSIPAGIRERQGLADYRTAVENIHFPKDLAICEEARRRLVFDEFFYLQAALAVEKNKVKAAPGITFSIPQDFLPGFEKLLPFKLTGSQRKVIGEIFADMSNPRPMNRLLQGDVGSGKTVVAVCAAYAAMKNGFQVVFMAPTEILAEQHFLNLREFLSGLGIKSVLLVSGISRKERESVLEDIAGGEADIAIGTHALLEQDVRFAKLGLAIIDEQHRFGVLQRAGLRQKGANPDVLVMTATPIPRTLALTLYGDLDVSVIREMPPGRKEIKTRLFSGNADRESVQEIVRGEIRSGRQVYIVYPLIEESEKIDLKAAVKEFERLKKVYPEFRLGLMHGRLPPDEKDDIMKNFKNGSIKILVSTTVIEVGIDVANASVMLIEHPERFGLAQLHQLRGRIGRGGYESTCILLASARLTEEARARINALVRTTDGFEIAEADLGIRGPGEFTGTRQSGMLDFRLADLVKDFRLLETAREEAFALAGADPDLSSEGNRPLKEMIRTIYKGREKLLKVA